MNLIIQYCQLYLQVHTFSDPTNSSGLWLDSNLHKGYHTHTTPQTKLVWFHQQRPGNTTWQNWTKANALWATKNWRLYVSLGKWLYPADQQLMEQASYTNSKKTVVYVCQPGRWKNTQWNILHCAQNLKQKTFGHRYTINKCPTARYK